MKLGVCTGFENIELAAKLGFEYLECGFHKLANMPEEDYQALLAKKDSFPIPVSKANLFLPGDVKPVGPDVSEKVLREYLDRAFTRGAAMGIKLVVFGSGGARSVPEGWSYARAWRQLCDFLELAAEYAEKYDIVIALEPLRSQECNILNYVSEGTALCGIVNHPYITVLGDFFHMHLGSEPWEHLARAGEKLSHIHICNPVGRVYPAANDGFDYETVLNILKDINYQGDVSIEAGVKDLEKEGAEAISLLKPLM